MLKHKDMNCWKMVAFMAKWKTNVLFWTLWSWNICCAPPNKMFFSELISSNYVVFTAPALGTIVFKDYQRTLIQQRDRDMTGDDTYYGEYNFFSCLSRSVGAFGIDFYYYY